MLPVYVRAHPFFSNICFLNGFYLSKKKKKRVANCLAKKDIGSINSNV